jgi:hypothetical protein
VTEYCFRQLNETEDSQPAPFGLCDPGSCNEVCGLPDADHAPVRRNPQLEPQPVGLEGNEFTSVTEELLDGSAALIWFDIFDEQQDKWRDMNAEIYKLSSLSTVNSVLCLTKRSSRPVPRSPSHRVWHRSYLPCNPSVTVALPSLPQFSFALLLLSFLLSQHLRPLPHRLL